MTDRPEEERTTGGSDLPGEAGPAEAKAEDKGPGFMRYIFWTAGGLIALLVLIFLVGLGVALLGAPEATATRVGMIRDVFIIILALEFILVILALVVLTLQVTRLIVMLQNEIKPILTDTRETVGTTRSTATFVSKNVSRPVIEAGAFAAGAWTFVREVGGIRRAIRKSKSNGAATEGTDDDGGE